MGAEDITADPRRILICQVVTGAEWMRHESRANALRRAIAFDQPDKMDRFDREVAVKDLEELHEARALVEGWQKAHMIAREIANKYAREELSAEGDAWAAGEPPRWIVEALGVAS